LFWQRAGIITDVKNAGVEDGTKAKEVSTVNAFLYTKKNGGG
jgi:hypothetical protein